MECLRHLQDIHQDNTLSRSQVYCICDQLRSGHNGSNGHGKYRDPTVWTPANIEIVAWLIEEDRRLTVTELLDESENPSSTIYDILVHDLQLKHVSARWVPHLVSEENCRERRRCNQDFFRMMRSEPGFLQRIITADGTWLHYGIPETKSQSKQWVPMSTNAPTMAQVVPQCQESNGHCFLQLPGPSLHALCRAGPESQR